MQSVLVKEPKCAGNKTSAWFIDVFSVNKVLSVSPSLSVLSISALTGGLLWCHSLMVVTAVLN